MICLVLFMHDIPVALVLALASAGRSMPARIAMMAITTSSSIKVKANRLALPGAEEWKELFIAAGMGCSDCLGYTLSPTAVQAETDLLLTVRRSDSPTV